MFDLHMHTTLSDGALSVSELTDRIKKANIDIFSITDHNHAKAYEGLVVEGLKLIPGTELATSYQGTIIEILGYKIDYHYINQWYDEFYSSKNLEKNEQQLFLDLKQKAQQIGYQIPDSLTLTKIEKGISKKTIFNYLSTTYPDFEYKKYKTFFRQGLCNPQSDWFIDEGRFYTSIPETIDLIHQAGGIAFLAHPYEYGFKDNQKLFTTVQEYGIDGIECFHPSAAMKQSVSLSDYCCENNLWGSGGSDFHRDEREIPLGVYAHQKVLAKPCFDWIKGV